MLNLRDKISGLAALSEKLLGFSARRSLREWQSKHFFNSAHASASREEVLTAARPVVLFVDTFNGYFESNVASSALKVLLALGFNTHIAAKNGANQKPLCCGRTYLASGMVDQARAKAAELVRALLPFA